MTLSKSLSWRAESLQPASHLRAPTIEVVGSKKSPPNDRDMHQSLWSLFSVSATFDVGRDDDLRSWRNPLGLTLYEDH